jgi:cell division protein FtsI (penicillin-binding protein 3)
MSASKAQPRPAKGASTGAVRRSLLLGGFLAFWVLGLVARLYYLQVIEYVEFVGRAQRQQQRTVEVAPNRGTIFDRQMHPLAMSVAVDSVYAVPSEIPDRDRVARVLAPVLGMDGGDLRGRFETFRSFCWVKRKISDREAERVRALNLKGVYFQKEMKRFYPKGELAAHVLGYVGLDDNGLAGLEFGMNKLIKGQPGRLLVVADARHRSFLSTEWKGEPGKNVVLTIDENIQYIAEKALAETVEKWHAAGGTVVVQNPSTGEILAMANSPALDANDYAKSPPGARVNRATGWVYEPGSTFKIVTVSGALEENLTNPGEVIDCQMGKIVLARHTIHDHKPFGLLTVANVLANSSDVGAIKLGLRLGDDRLYRYIRDFGFGEKTEIQLPGEERGLLRPPSHWSGISIGAISMGQEVGVTPLQLATAYSAIANGGVLIQPTIVRDVFRDNRHDSLRPPIGRRAVSERTARLMRAMFEGVVDHGTATAARLNGYSAAGKTGTAQKIDASGRYSKSHFISSFVGFAPVEHPAVTILVVIDSPVGAIYGGSVAGPAFRSIAEQTLGYLDVPQDNPAQLPQVASSASATSARQGREDVAEILPTDSETPEAATPSLEPVSFTSLSDAAGAPLPSDRGTVVVDRGPLTTVPDFSGLAVRGVADKCEQLDLELSVRGTGLAVEQSPPAGAQVPAGSGITVRFAR